MTLAEQLKAKATEVNSLKEKEYTAYAKEALPRILQKLEKQAERGEFKLTLNSQDVVLSQSLLVSGKDYDEVLLRVVKQLQEPEYGFKVDMVMDFPRLVTVYW